jgi:hypothetical protein
LGIILVPFRHLKKWVFALFNLDNEDR